MQRHHSRLSATAAAAALVALVWAPGAWAWGHGFQGRGGDRLERAVESLDLPADQRAKVFAVIDGARPAQRDLDAQIRSAHEAMRGLLDQSTPNSDAVMAQADKLGALELQARKAKLGTFLQVRALLTPEQQQRLRTALEPPKTGRHRGGWGGRGGPGGPPPADGNS